ncbi:MAG: hypothetical protein EOO42_20685 [Flavobacteriales bacterium]|nr:MAG: hypothetical protein EOO42_20685 [Flavobacteriales bacterium]
MAKVRSIIEISGTLSEITFVDSKAYGTHARAKRGTYTPITLPDGMQKSAKVQTQVNQLAKVVFDAVNTFVPGFKNGKLWPRLLSIFRQQNKLGKNYSYKDFDLMEIRVDHPTSKQGSFRLASRGEKTVQLHYQLGEEATYRIRLLRMASDATLLNPYPTEMLEITITHSPETKVALLTFSNPPENANLLYVLHCDRLINDQPSEILKYQGVKFFG